MLRHGAWCMAALAVLLASAALAVTAADVDVCVIGAGPAGIGAALGLASKGKSFVLLERNGWVGGQTSPEYRDPATGSRLHMGAVVLTPPDYPLVMQLADQVGLGVQPYSTGQGAYFWGASGPLRIITPHANASGTAPVFLRHAADDFLGLAVAMQRYSQMRRDLMPLLLNPGGLPAVLRAAPELAVNGDAWLAANHLSELAPICAQMLLQTGYGHLYQSSAAQMLLYLSPFVLVAGFASSGVDVSALMTWDDTQGWQPGLYAFTDDVGFVEVLRRLSLTLPTGSLILNASITAVVRPPPGGPGAGGPVSVTYTQPADDGTATESAVTCGSLLNTVAQALPNLGFLQLDDVESAVFSKVIYARYFTTAVAVTPPTPLGAIIMPLPQDQGVFTHPAGPLTRWWASRVTHRQLPGAGITPPAVPWLSALADPYPYTGQVCSAWSTNYGASNRPAGVPYTPDGLEVAYSYSDVDVNATEVAHEAARTFTRGKYKAEVRKSYAHVYYPRVSEVDARGGWYETLDGLQGRRQTYHAGGMLTFWDVEHALRSGLDAVARFF